MFNSDQFEKNMLAYVEAAQKMKEAYVEALNTGTKGGVHIQFGNSNKVNSENVSEADKARSKWVFESLAIAATKAAFTVVNGKTQKPEEVAEYVFSYVESLTNRIEDKFKSE